jgi:hypothetical protein
LRNEANLERLLPGGAFLSAALLGLFEGVGFPGIGGIEVECALWLRLAGLFLALVFFVAVWRNEATLLLHFGQGVEGAVEISLSGR